MNASNADIEAISSPQALAAYLEAGCKPKTSWRVGTEHEKFGFRRSDLSPIPYEGAQGIHALLLEMADRFNWQIIYEKETPIGLQKADAAITLEPGGQLELSGAPLEDVHQTEKEINEHLDQLAKVCRDMDMAFLGVGTQPLWAFEKIPWMPKGRYRLMRSYLPLRGKYSLDMMTRTATVQANLDFSSEADMVAKFRLSLALQPLVTALFANSPFLNGKPNGFQSFRAEIWRYTDPDRCGGLPFVFEPGFGFERYVDYALDVPMFFLYRDGNYLDVKGATFRRFLEKGLEDYPNEQATMTDWETHLSTLFPDVRLKRYLEMRGADAGNSATLCALPAFWMGVLYDSEALLACWDLVKGWNSEVHEQINQQIPVHGLKTEIPGSMQNMLNLGREVLGIAQEGLQRRNRRSPGGCDESIYLNWLFDIVESGQSPADRLLEAYHSRWQKEVTPIFREEEFESFYADCR
ncbi:glutamate--cysteine ligase [Magnetococcales bacterium HHB-1]